MSLLNSDRDYTWEFTSDGSNTQNSSYLCVLTCVERSIILVANLPQSYQLDISANYEESFAQGLNNMIPESVQSVGKAVGMQFTTQALTAQVWQGTSEIAFTLPLIFQVENSPDEVIRPLADLFRLVLPREISEGGMFESPGPSLDLEKLLRELGSKRTTDALSRGANQIKNGSVGTIDGAFKLNLSQITKGALDARKGANTVLGAASTALRNSIKNRISLSIGNFQHFSDVVVTNVGQNYHVRPLQDGTMCQVEVNVGIKTFFVPTQADIPRMFFNRESAMGGEGQR